MITDHDGKQITPKAFAQDILADAVAVAHSYWEEKVDATGQLKKMSAKEKREVDRHIKILSNRIARMLGFDGTWTQ